MLKWNTVDELLKEVLLKLMAAKEFSEMRLVGGTALSLHLGHRMSIDIDLFADAELYGKLDFDAMEDFLLANFKCIQGDFGAQPGMGKSYLVGPSKDNLVKLDLYYSQDPFFQDLILEDNVRLATVEEIIAMKVDVIQRGGRKKDFWDLHELLESYSIKEMIKLHEQRFEWTHDAALISKNFADFSIADPDFNPVCLRNKEWEFIKDDFIKLLKQP
ncbi:nucleotidyl transferase AbiEii/AbiGii toxin family protein [Pedobacter psychrodurus]|uniref:Nucleotidyl transferase AbiEii/AbiGii toxin family protein n=1 Tax=Pedobacter psychrodurus TaxID=2530456 RepID=A0A4R0Q0Z5_9SPHI|nr:nucleotidyl transferase AbiEii/AbiGii toxin family protein [Pedobacter psychrodurus]TCD28646.1 nucleotidyl transferase AbiEii/AbiGii toxin family protein [Pedobacter psychrodurus]